MLSIAWITLRRIAERAVLIQLAILTLVLVYVALGLQAIMLNDEAGTEQSGIFVTLTFLAAFTMFWTTLEIPREINRKETQLYLSKPITRLQYLLGKFLGMAGMVVGSELILLGIFAVCLLIKGQRPNTWLFFAAARTALLLIFLNALCTAASVVFSEMRAIVAASVVMLLSTVMFALPVMAWAAFDRTPSAGWISAYYLVPNLLHYRWEPEKGRFLAYLANLFLYTAGWAAVVLTIATHVLIRRDLP